MTEITLVNGESIVISEDFELIQRMTKSFDKQSLTFIKGTMKGKPVIINKYNILYFVEKEEKKGLTPSEIANLM